MTASVAHSVTAVHSLPSGALVEEHENGLYLLRQSETTRVSQTWLTESDIAALAAVIDSND